MRARPILQLSPTECGLACTAMVMRSHRRGVTMRHLRRLVDVGRDGLSLQKLRTILIDQGFDVKIMRGSARALRLAPLPAICMWQDSHFVVVDSIRNDKYRVLDPASGAVTMDYEEFADGYTELVLVATPRSDAPILKDTEPWVWRRYLAMLRDAWPLVAVSVVVTLIGYGLSLVVPSITQRVIDGYGADNGFDGLAWTAVVMLGTVLFAVTLLQVVNTTRLSMIFGRRLMTQTFRRLLRLPYRYFGTRGTGELIYRLSNVSALRDLLTSEVVQGVLDVGMIVCVFAFMMHLSPPLALVAAGLFLVIGGVQFGARHKIQDAINAEMNQLSVSQGMQIEAVTGIAFLKLSASEDQFLSEWGKVYERSLVKMRRRAMIQGWVSSLVNGVQTAGPLVILLLGLDAARQGALTVGGAVAFQSLSVTFFGLSSTVYRSYSDYLIASAYIDRLTDIASADEDDWADPGEADGMDGAIEVEHVSFRFTADGADVIKDISFSVAPGERVAIVGLSGSGKTTLGELLSGLHQPTAGSVSYSRRPIRSYDRHYFYSMVGVVPQQITLVNRSIRENISMGHEPDDPDRVTVAAEAAQIHQEICQMPMGYETPIAELGANISGGQRQRIALARALFKQPRILILDEATSSLDSMNESRITHHLREQQCTQVIIAHRLATVQDADRILVLRDGQIVESGTHDELVSSSGFYSELYGVQLDPTPM